MGQSERRQVTVDLLGAIVLKAEEKLDEHGRLVEKALS